MKPLPGMGLCAAAASLAVLGGVLFVAPGAWTILAALWAALASAAVLDGLRARHIVRSIGAALAVPSSCQRGERVEATLVLRNDGATPALVDVRVELPAQTAPAVWRQQARIPARSQLSFSHVVPATVRGTYAFGNVHLRAATHLRLIQVQSRISNSAVCRVLPDVERVKEYLLARRIQTAGAPQFQKSRLRGIGSEFESLRDYEDGDDIRHIDWKATAKHARLISRNYEIEPYRNIVVVLDRGRLMAAQAGNASKFDHAVDACLMISAVALDSGDRVGVLVFDVDVAAYLPPRAGLHSLSTIVNQLHDIQPVYEESHFQRAFAFLQSRLRKRSLVVVVSDFADPDASGGAVRALLTLARKHLALVAALRTPEVLDTIQAPVSDEMSPFRKAVAYRLVRERREVISHMRKGGAFVLDVAPEDLSIPLVNRYIELREQNRL